MADHEEVYEGTGVDYDDPEEEKTVGQQSSHYVGMHTSNFKDFNLKPELLRAITDCGFEHPSAVQYECIPHVMLGMDVICQAKSGMGKTAVFVLATLHQLDPVKDEAHVVVLAHVRELAFQICAEYTRFSNHLHDVKTKVFYGGVKKSLDIESLKVEVPNIVVGTPGRIMDLCTTKPVALNLSKVKNFVLDECDQLLQQVDVRRQVQQIFMATPHEKQVMMFSATLDKETRPICKKFCQDAMEIFIDDETKLTLHGLVQYVVELDESEKNRKLNDLLDALEFNQVVIFVSKVKRATELAKLLKDCNFPAMYMHSQMKQEERIARFKQFKDFKERILVTTDLFGRGIDIEKVNIVINYDFPDREHGSDQYLHRVGRAGRFGTKGLAISFLSTQEDKDEMAKVQSRFAVTIPPLPETIDTALYM